MCRYRFITFLVGPEWKSTGLRKDENRFQVDTSTILLNRSYLHRYVHLSFLVTRHIDYKRFAKDYEHRFEKHCGANWKKDSFSCLHCQGSESALFSPPGSGSVLYICTDPDPNCLLTVQSTQTVEQKFAKSHYKFSGTDLAKLNFSWSIATAALQKFAKANILQKSVFHEKSLQHLCKKTNSPIPTKISHKFVFH